ncbi:hypothetical protein C9374_004526 [Naegleria lovaniensis]|uniref:Uncharacterized protein n=1 Tax=Naegleria lovaniensis TaxID=51637 RepID=A0AA88GLJ3_NAELO|nr:uncharacterized protein C9374_004526 [Naegleria lovaniensis]KAG2383189.1 hypothetical protein C9374_004526 [Naegleria lovaniensis]
MEGSASSVLMDCLNHSISTTPGLREEQLSLNEAEVISLGSNSSPRSTMSSSSLIELDDIQLLQNTEKSNNNVLENSWDHSQLILLEHSYQNEYTSDEKDCSFNDHSTVEQQTEISYNVSAQSEIDKTKKSTRSSNLVKGTTTTTRSRITTPQTTSHTSRDEELEFELSEAENELLYKPPDQSHITLKDKNEILKSVERLKVRQRYLEDKVKKENKAPVKPRITFQTKKDEPKPINSRVFFDIIQPLNYKQVQHSIEEEKRRRRIEEKRKELAEQKIQNASKIREEQKARESAVKARFSYEMTKRPSTPSTTKRPSTPSTNKRPSSSQHERPKSSQGLTGLFHSFVSDSSYNSEKDSKEFSLLVKEQEKLLSSIQELKAKLQATTTKTKKLVN